MQIIIDEIDNIYYADLILTPNDIQQLRVGDMVTQNLTYKHRKCYVGVRLQGEWDYDKEVKRRDEGLQGDEGVFQGRAPQRVKGRPRRSE